MSTNDAELMISRKNAYIAGFADGVEDHVENLDLMQTPYVGEVYEKGYEAGREERRVMEEQLAEQLERKVTKAIKSTKAMFRSDADIRASGHAVKSVGIQS